MRILQLEVGRLVRHLPESPAPPDKAFELRQSNRHLRDR
jgi:hypothetical protein